MAFPPPEEPLVLRLPPDNGERNFRALEVISWFNRARMKPREIRGRDLAPDHINAKYIALWQAEGKELLAVEAANAQKPEPVGKWRAIWRLLFH